MVVYQGATIGLEAAVVEGFDLTVQAPVPKMLLGQDGKAVSWLHDHDFGTWGQTGETVLLAGHFADVLGDGAASGQWSTRPGWGK